MKQLVKSFTIIGISDLEAYSFYYPGQCEQENCFRWLNTVFLFIWVERKRISVRKDFNENGFHFHKVRDAEVMFIYDDVQNSLSEFNGFENMTDQNHALIINVNPIGNIFLSFVIYLL